MNLLSIKNKDRINKPIVKFLNIPKYNFKNKPTLKVPSAYKAYFLKVIWTDFCVRTAAQFFV